MKNCPYCNNPIYDSAKRCMFCGRNLDLELARKLELQKAARDRLNKTVKIAFYAFAAVVILVAIMLWGAIYSPIGAIAQRAATQTAVVMNYCNPDEVRAASDQLIDLNDRWADVMALAVSVDRDSVVMQVDRLQTMRRDAKAVDTPECMRSAHQWLVRGMEAHIEGMLAYVREEPIEKVNDFLTSGNMDMNAFAGEAERLQRCAPTCR